MIMRTWRAKALQHNADSYGRHLQEAVLPKLRGIEGYKGAYLLRRSQGNHAELLVLTMWESMEAVRKFAGDSPNTAVVESAAQAMLEQFETVVDHYDVVVSAP
jgi:heme-degrading monooxygenase HmoA